MPINVTCPECQFAFLVGDEFAGRPGRCPECAAVIQVPGNEPQPPEIHLDPSPYHTPRGVEAYEEFPDRARRRREQDERDAYDERDDYDDQPMERTFDTESRIRSWTRVYKGLGFIQIAVILYFFNQVLQSVFMVVHGGMDRQDIDAGPDSGEIAIGAGVAFIMLFACVFWILGRLSFIKVPYVPARGWAKASFFMVLASIASMLGFCCFFVMALGAMGNAGAVAFIMFALMMALLAMAMVAGGELCGLMALAKIGDGLRASSAANWARMSMVLMIVLGVVIMIGACGVGIYGAEQQRKKQERNANFQNQKIPLPPVAKEEPVPKAKKKEQKKDVVEVPINPPAGQNQQQKQQNPFEDDGLDDTTRIVFQGAMIGLILLYLIQYSIALQKGRRAIRTEIRRLSGDTDDQNDYRDERY